MDKHEDLTERLDALKRELRWVTGIGAALFVGAIVLLAESTAGLGPAEGLVLRDQAGQVRARLAVAPDDGPELTFYDPLGRHQVQLKSFTNGTSSLSLFDGDKVRAYLEAGGGPASLHLFGRDDESHSVLFMRSDGTTGLGLRNDRLTVVSAIQPDGVGGLYVADCEGAERGRIGAFPEGVMRPSLDLFGIGEPLFRPPLSHESAASPAVDSTR